MPRNGSGQYSAPATSFNPAVPETAILSDDWNTTLDDLSTAMSGSLASDGQTPTTAMIHFSQGVGLSAGALATPSLTATADTNTGLYFPAADQISIVAGGVAAVVVTSTTVTFPLAVTFSGSPSIAGNLTVTGNLTVNGNTTIGNAPGDTLTVAATGTFTGNQTFSGSITVPDASFTNAKLANMATQTIKGRTTAGTGVPEDLTATQATAILNAFTGDSGSGGVKGLVPAPAAGDTAAFKYLRANGTWADVYAARGLFNGSTGATVVSKGGITCTKNSTGDYSFAISPALSTANYQVVVVLETSVPATVPAVHTKTTSSFQLESYYFDGATFAVSDPDQISVLIVV